MGRSLQGRADRQGCATEDGNNLRLVLIGHLWALTRRRVVQKRALVVAHTVGFVGAEALEMRRSEKGEGMISHAAAFRTWVSADAPRTDLQDYFLLLKKEDYGTITGAI